MKGRMGLGRRLGIGVRDGRVVGGRGLGTGGSPHSHPFRIAWGIQDSMLILE